MGGAIINDVAKDRPELAVAARVLSQRTANPTQGTIIVSSEPFVMRHHTRRGVSMFPCGAVDDTLRKWTESDWAEDVIS